MDLWRDAASKLRPAPIPSTGPMRLNYRSFDLFQMRGSSNLFTNLKNWLRPADRMRRRFNVLPRLIESLEERTVPNATYYPLSGGSLQQFWANPGLITANNDWSNVPSIEGYNGAGLAAS